MNCPSLGTVGMTALGHVRSAVSVSIRGMASEGKEVTTHGGTDGHAGTVAAEVTARQRETRCPTHSASPKIEEAVRHPLIDLCRLAPQIASSPPALRRLRCRVVRVRRVVTGRLSPWWVPLLPRGGGVVRGLWWVLIRVCPVSRFGGGVPFDVVAGAHRCGPAAGCDGAVVGWAGQAEVVDVGQSALGPILGDVVDLAAVGPTGQPGLVQPPSRAISMILCAAEAVVECGTGRGRSRWRGRTPPGSGSRGAHADHVFDGQRVPPPVVPMPARDSRSCRGWCAR